MTEINNTLSEIDSKLNLLCRIWCYIVDENYLHNEVIFSQEAKTGYIGMLIGYFRDTLKVVFNNTKYTNYDEIFARNISLLQAIYVQQDFITELLIVFKINIKKKYLANHDRNYYLNRNLRNELIGHPIRRQGEKFISSTLFSYQKIYEDHIQYVKLHNKDQKDILYTNVISHSICDIQNRHKEFLNTYLDKILNRSKSILYEYNNQLSNLERIVNNRDFYTIINEAKNYYESIFKSNYAYDPQSLTYIYNHREEHRRYQSFLDQFYNDLESDLKDMRRNIIEMFDPSQDSMCSNPNNNTNIILEEIYCNKNIELSKSTPDYNYDIEKLATNRTSIDLYFQMLKSICHQSDEILAELNHMKQNQNNEAEYYAALSLLKELLNK